MHEKAVKTLLSYEMEDSKVRQRKTGISDRLESISPTSSMGNNQKTLKTCILLRKMQHFSLVGALP